MGELGTNLFRITNLEQLSSQYQKYLIKGLNSTQPDYYQNCQILQKQLSYLLQNPVLVFEQDQLTYLVVRSDLQFDLPHRFPITSNKAVSFEKRSESQYLDYTLRSDINDAICIRFLQFTIQGCIRKHSELWQTQSGFPFYKKEPSYISKQRQRFSGFGVRPIIMDDEGIGLCVDMTSKTISRHPLPEYLPRNEFHKWKGQRCIYHYGDNWYEIQINSLDETYSEHFISLENFKFISLQEYITKNVPEPLPPELAQLSPDASVVTYFNNRGEERAAPTPLCYPIYGTDDDQTGQQHSGTLLSAQTRYDQILETAKNYLSNLFMGDLPIKIEDQPFSAPATRSSFQVPDLLFGNDTVLSVRGTKGAKQTSLNQLGKRRVEVLQDKQTGYYADRPFDHQYLILPLSVYRSWGKPFIEDLKRQVAKQYQADRYEPEIVYYDDSGKLTFVAQGRKLQKFIRNHNWQPGFAVMMIHHTTDKQIREEDQLGAMVLQELSACGIQGAVIHSEVGADCYVYQKQKDGKNTYVWSDKSYKRGKLAGYLRNVALNKVLLTNSLWPFILQTPLHADVTIGLDVKGHYASLIVVGKRGGRIRRSPIYKSKQKEKLLEGQARKYFLEVLREEIHASSGSEEIRQIVIHRDGTAYESEIRGIHAAIDELKTSGDLPDDASVTILEIAKSSIVPVRFFDITRSEVENDRIVNPEVGDFHSVNQRDGYVCATGRAFESHGKQNGTTVPLHVHYVEGSMTLEACLEDVYALTTLAWTQPRDCSRYPITIRLNDRFLRDEATEYDHEKLEFSYE